MPAVTLLLQIDNQPVLSMFFVLSAVMAFALITSFSLTYLSPWYLQVNQFDFLCRKRVDFIFLIVQWKGVNLFQSKLVNICRHFLRNNIFLMFFTSNSKEPWITPSEAFQDWRINHVQKAKPVYFAQLDAQAEMTTLNFK